MDLSTLDISYKWNYIVCGFLWLTSVTWHNVFKILPSCSMNHFFIPIYCWIILHCMDMPYFVYQVIVIWVLSRFWAITNNAVMDTQVQVFVWTCFQLSCIYTWKWNFWIYGNFICNFVKNCQPVFQSGCTILHFH